MVKYIVLVETAKKVFMFIYCELTCKINKFRAIILNLQFSCKQQIYYCLKISSLLDTVKETNFLVSATHGSAFFTKQKV